MSDQKHPIATNMSSTSRFQLQLTPEQVAAAEQLVASYFDFWSHIRFRMGIESPPFDRSEIETELYAAAYDVVRIQSYLDIREPSFKIRLLGGNARAYLHSLKALPTDRRVFIRDICMASFQDGSGCYVESSEEEISDFLTELQLLKDSVRRRPQPKPRPDS